MPHTPLCSWADLLRAHNFWQPLPARHNVKVGHSAVMELWQQKVATALSSVVFQEGKMSRAYIFLQRDGADARYALLLKPAQGLRAQPSFLQVPGQDCHILQGRVHSLSCTPLPPHGKRPCCSLTLKAQFCSACFSVPAKACMCQHAPKLASYVCRHTCRTHRMSCIANHCHLITSISAPKKYRTAWN